MPISFQHHLQPLKQHLIKDNKNGAPMAILFAQFALLSTSVFLYNTTVIKNHDGGGIITVLSYQIVALLLPYSKVLGKLKFFRWDCGWFLHILAGTVCLVLGIIVPIYYEKYFDQFAVLGVALSIVVLFLVLLIIIRPRSDLGFFNFPIGMATLIAGKHYKLGYMTWIVVVICVVILIFKYWLKKNWLEPEEADLNKEVPLLPTNNTRSSSSSRRRSSITQGNETIYSKLWKITEAIIVPGFYLGWDLYLLIISSSCPPHSDLISCIPSALKKSVPFVFGLCFSFVIVLRFYSSCIRQNRVRTSDENRALARSYGARNRVRVEDRIIGDDDLERRRRTSSEPSFARGF